MQGQGEWWCWVIFVLPSPFHQNMSKLPQRQTPRQLRSKFRDAHGGTDCANLEALMEQDWSCACRMWSRMLGDMLFETMIGQTWMPYASYWGDVVGACDSWNWQAVIERGWRYTWRPWFDHCEHSLRGRDHTNLEAITDSVWTCTWN